MFWSRPTVSDDMRDWIAECFDWFDARFEPPSVPILPTREFFSAPGGQDAATAELVLSDIQRLTGIERRIELMPLDVLPEELRIDYHALSATAGTFQESGNSAIIQYDPELMKRPLLFINTMVHEVMHARLSGLEHDIPGGAAVHELATDLGCIIAGFGVFQLQAADDAGWTGYLRQPSRAHALALFLRRRELGIEAVAAHLSPRCRKLLRQAMKQI